MSANLWVNGWTAYVLSYAQRVQSYGAVGLEASYGNLEEWLSIHAGHQSSDSPVRCLSFDFHCFQRALSVQGAMTLKGSILMRILFIPG
jgi:hypothetical protein